MDRRISGGGGLRLLPNFGGKVQSLLSDKFEPEAQGGDELGHDPDRPCVGESGGIPLISLYQGPGRDWSFAPMGLVLVCDTPLICRKGRMFNAPDVLISQAALCLCLVPRSTTLDMVSMWKLFVWKFYVKCLFRWKCVGWMVVG